MRKLALMGLAALMLCAFAASSASAVSVYDQNTGATLNNNSQVNGVGTSNKLTGTILGAVTTITCTGSSIVGTVIDNGTSSAIVTGSVTNATWTGCTNQLGVACTVTGKNFPSWAPSAGGLRATTTTSVDLGLGSTGYIEINGTNCLPGSGVCDFVGASTISPLVAAVHGTWTNAFPQLSISSQSVTTTSGTNCTVSNTTWSATYDLRTGGTVGSGDQVGLH